MGHAHESPSYVSISKNNYVKHDLVNLYKNKKPTNASTDMRKEHF